MALHDRPQAHRHPLSGFDHALLLSRRTLRIAGAIRAGDAGGRSGFIRNLQQAFLYAWDHHGLLLSGPIHSRRTRKLSRPPDDRRARCRVSQIESVELVSIEPGWIVMLYAVLHGGVDTGWTFY